MWRRSLGGGGGGGDGGGGVQGVEYPALRSARGQEQTAWLRSRNGWW